MSPHAEQFEAQERLRRMEQVAQYLQQVRQPDDPLRINFLSYMDRYVVRLRESSALPPPETD